MLIKNTWIKIGKKKTSMTCDLTLTEEHFLDFNMWSSKLFLYTYVNGVVQKVDLLIFKNKLCTKNIQKGYEKHYIT